MNFARGNQLSTCYRLQHATNQSAEVKQRTWICIDTGTIKSDTDKDHSEISLLPELFGGKEYPLDFLLLCWCMCGGGRRGPIAYTMV